MISINEIKVGQIATVKLTGEHKMNKRNNPLVGRVTRDHRIVVQVAGPESYTNRLEKQGETPAGRAPWFQWVKPGIVQHKTTGDLYLAATPTRREPVTRYLVDGRPATQDEIATIREFTPDKGEPEFLCFRLENVENIGG